MTLVPRALVVHRRTELEELVDHHGTRQQAGFFLRSRGRDLEDVETADQAQHAALDAVSRAIPVDWRRVQVERADLARFTFGPEDVVVAVGQDGLVANVAKYLDGQVVVGINPRPGVNPGVLVPHAPAAAADLLARAVAPDVGSHIRRCSMVEAEVDDGQVLRALNEVYVGHPTHQSARYRITTVGGTVERQSSSGVLVGTGTGATGWCRSAALERRSALALPAPADPCLCWYVREAWPSPATGTTLTEGLLEHGEALVVTAESDLVAFGDGMERDALAITWGQSVTLRLARHRLHLLV